MTAGLVIDAALGVIAAAASIILWYRILGGFRRV